MKFLLVHCQSHILTTIYQLSGDRRLPGRQAPWAGQIAVLHWLNYDNRFYDFPRLTYVPPGQRYDFRTSSSSVFNVDLLYLYARQGNEPHLQA